MLTTDEVRDVERRLRRAQDGYALQLELEEEEGIDLETARELAAVRAGIVSDRHGLARWLAAATVRGDVHNRRIVSLQPVPRAIALLADHVVELGLGGRALTRLPVELTQLTRLERLIVDGAPRLRVLPRQLGELTSLRVLRLFKCPIATLPASLTRLSRIEELSVVSSRLAALPHGMDKLRRLQTLVVAGAPLRELPDELGAALERLSFVRTRVAVVPPGIVALRRLRVVASAATPLATRGRGLAQEYDEPDVAELLADLWFRYVSRALAPAIRKYGLGRDADGDYLLYAEAPELFERLEAIYERYLQFNHAPSDAAVFWRAIADALDDAADAPSEETWRAEPALQAAIESLNNERGLPDPRFIDDEALRQTYRGALERLEACPELVEVVDVRFRSDLASFFSRKLIEQYISLIERLLVGASCTLR